MTDARSFLKSAIDEEKKSPGNEVEKVHYLNEISILLPSLLYAKMVIALLKQLQGKKIWLIE